MFTQYNSTSYDHQPQPGLEVDDYSSANGFYEQPSDFAGYNVASQPPQIVYFNQQNPYYEAPPASQQHAQPYQGEVQNWMVPPASQQHAQPYPEEVQSQYWMMPPVYQQYAQTHQEVGQTQYYGAPLPVQNQQEFIPDQPYEQHAASELVGSDVYNLPSSQVTYIYPQSRPISAPFSTQPTRRHFHHQQYDQMSEEDFCVLKREANRLLLEKYPFKAERKFQQLYRTHPECLEVALGIARAILHQGNPRKYNRAESILLSFEQGVAKSKASEYFRYHTTLVNLWDAMGHFSKSKQRLMTLCPKYSTGTEDTGSPFDYTLARHLLNHGRKQRHEHMLVEAENIMLKLSGKSPDMEEDDLCKPTAHGKYDLTYALILHHLGKKATAEKLLLALTNKDLSMNDKDLCKPSGDLDIDHLLAKVWQSHEKYELEERLLLALNGKSPGMPEEALCEPSKNYKVDITLAITWEKLRKFSCAEKLLLAMSKKTLGMGNAKLTKQSGHPKVDATLAKLWLSMGKKGLGSKLLRSSQFVHA